MSTSNKADEDGKVIIENQSDSDASEPVVATATVVASSESMAETEETEKPWMDDDWVPLMKSGKQKSPNMIRNQLQKYIDECKANRTMTQTAIIQSMGVNNNSFRRFMNPKTYKNQWSATSNSTYDAAARLLEEVQYDKEQAKKAEKEKNKLAKKRKAFVAIATIVDDEGSKKVKAGKSNLKTSTTTTATVVTTKNKTPTKSKPQLKQEMYDLIQRINAVEDISIKDGVYDTCAQVVKKIKAFLAREGMNKAMLLEALGNINTGSMNRFLSGKGQDQCGNITYRQAYIFFEKLRVLEGKPKSKARLKNEAEKSGGFSLVKERAGKWIKVLPSIGLY